MSGLKNTVRRLGNASMGKGYKTGKEIKAEKAAKAQNALDKVYAGAEVPDDEMLKRKERRKAAKRQGSRANTILTNNDDQLG
jgi:hypothetical protein